MELRRFTIFCDCGGALRFASFVVVVVVVVVGGFRSFVRLAVYEIVFHKKSCFACFVRTECEMNFCRTLVPGYGGIPVMYSTYGAYAYSTYVRTYILKKKNGVSGAQKSHILETAIIYAYTVAILYST